MYNMCALILYFFLSYIQDTFHCGLCNDEYRWAVPGGGVIRALLGCGAGKGCVMSHVACRGEDTHNELYVSIWFTLLFPSFCQQRLLFCLFSYENPLLVLTLKNNTVNMQIIKISRRTMSFIWIACVTTISRLHKLCMIERAHDYEWWIRLYGFWSYLIFQLQLLYMDVSKW
jgi:hypothetical protein